MKATIKKKVYDTDKATSLGHKYTGEYGQQDGFEERLFVTQDGQHFIYGVGGSDSPYAKPEIKLVTEKQAAQWKTENDAPAT